MLDSLFITIRKIWFPTAMVTSLEIRPLAALYPPPYFLKTDIMERSANAVGISIPPPATTESEDRERSSRSLPYISTFL